MDLSGYLRALRRRWWIVVATIVIGALLGVLKTIIATNVYSASITFFIASPQLNNTNAAGTDQFAQDRANSYAELLSSEQLANQVQNATGIAVSPTDLTSKISGTAELNTVLIKAQVLDTDPARLKKIAAGVAQQFPIMIGALENRSGEQEVALNVVSGPSVSPTPVSPRPTLNLALGIGLGLIVGLLLAALREALDTSLRSPAELEELTGLPVLGSIVYDSSAEHVRALVGPASQSRRAEDFRQLRTNLDFVHTVESVQVLAVTSSVAGEGKSSTAVNVAVMAAERGARVLLVDADLRRPQVADYLGLETSVGLTTVLSGRVSFDDAVRTWGDMQVLPSGRLPPNPTELLDSVAMAELVTEWRSRFDLIVIDTPPVLAVADAVVCSAIVDATLVIYRYGRTRRAQVAGALRALQGVDARVIGTVLNARPKRGGDAEYSAGYGEYIDPTRHVYEKMRSATQDQDVLRALREGLLSAPAGERRTGGRATDGGWRPGAEPPAEPSAAPPPKKTPPASAHPGGGSTNPRESGRRSTHRSTRSGRQRD